MVLEFTAANATTVEATTEVVYPNYKLRKVNVLIREQANTVSFRAVCVPIDANGSSLLLSKPIIIQENNLYGLGQDNAVDNFVNRLSIVTNFVGQLSGDFA